MNGFVILWVNNTTCAGFFPRFPSGSLSYSRELRVTDVYILAVGREKKEGRGKNCQRKKGQKRREKE